MCVGELATSVATVYALAFAPDGRTCAMVARGKVVVWDVDV